MKQVIIAIVAIVSLTSCSKLENKRNWACEITQTTSLYSGKTTTTNTNMTLYDMTESDMKAKIEGPTTISNGYGTITTSTNCH